MKYIIRLHILRKLVRNRVPSLASSLGRILPSPFDDDSVCRLSCCRLFPLRRVCLCEAPVLWFTVGGVPSFAHHSFLIQVLHTGLCSSLGTSWHTFSSAVRPKYTHTTLFAIAFFFSKEVLRGSGSSAISPRTKSSGTHVAICLVSCRIASPSSVSERYTVQTI